MAMTSRERILTCFEHRSPDRVPTFIWINRDAMDGLLAHLGLNSDREAHERLRIDRWESVGLQVRWPDECQALIDSLVPDEYRDDEQYRVMSGGRVVRVHPGSDYLEDVVWLPLAEAERPEDLDFYPFPREEWITVPEDLPDRIQALKDEGAVVIGELTQPFKAAWLVRGMDNVLMDYAIRPGLLDRLYDILYGWARAVGVRLVEAGVDMVQITGDLAMQNSLIMSPDAWRRFDKGRLKALISGLKAANPAAYVMMHTDGDSRAIVPDLIECGLDVLNPIQPECMDPAEFKRDHGDRLVMHGCVSLQKTLPFGTPEDVRAEIRHLIEHCSMGGGLCLGPSNVIFKEIPLENVVAMYDAVGEC